MDFPFAWLVAETYDDHGGAYRCPLEGSRPSGSRSRGNGDVGFNTCNWLGMGPATASRCGSPTQWSEVDCTVEARSQALFDNADEELLEMCSTPEGEKIVFQTWTLQDKPTPDARHAERSTGRQACRSEAARRNIDELTRAAVMPSIIWAAFRSNTSSGESPVG